MGYESMCPAHLCLRGMHPGSLVNVAVSGHIFVYLDGYPY